METIELDLVQDFTQKAIEDFLSEKFDALELMAYGLLLKKHKRIAIQNNQTAREVFFENQFQSLIKAIELTEEILKM